MARRVNDFKCGDCGETSMDILFSTTVLEHEPTAPMFVNENEHNLNCVHCGSSNLTKLIGAAHHSSDGGKGIGARTPDGFKDVLKAIKKGTPEKYRGDRFNSV